MRILIIAFALFAAAPTPVSQASPEQIEREAWRALQLQDVGEIKRLFGPDGVYAEKTYGFARSVLRTKVLQYKLGKMTSQTLPGGDIRLMYTMEAQTIDDGKPILKRLIVGSIWHREKGRWRCIDHAEIEGG